MIAVRKNFTREALAVACRQFGAQVGPLPLGVDGAQLLWALAGVESSFGSNCQPRHEAAYDAGGHYAAFAPMPNLLSRFGEAAACSYGPWQLLMCNAPLTYAPVSFDNLTLCAQPSVHLLNHKLIVFKPQSLGQIGECWNTGRICKDPDYEAKLIAAYGVELPAA